MRSLVLLEMAITLSAVELLPKYRALLVCHIRYYANSWKKLLFLFIIGNLRGTAKALREKGAEHHLERSQGGEVFLYLD